MFSQEHDLVCKSFVKARSKIGALVKDARGQFPFASLPAVLDLVKPHLSDNGLAISSTIGNDDKGVQWCQSRLVHESGQWIESRCPIVAFQDNTGKRSSMQVLGGAYTYARRYSILGLLGLSAADDDGESAGRPNMGRNEHNESRHQGRTHAGGQSFEQVRDEEGFGEQAPRKHKMVSEPKKTYKSRGGHGGQGHGQSGGRNGGHRNGGR